MAGQRTAVAITGEPSDRRLVRICLITRVHSACSSRVCCPLSVVLIPQAAIAANRTTLHQTVPVPNASCCAARLCRGLAPACDRIGLCSASIDPRPRGELTSQHSPFPPESKPATMPRSSPTVEPTFRAVAAGAGTGCGLEGLVVEPEALSECDGQWRGPDQRQGNLEESEAGVGGHR
jgi:hypothetical protein